MMSGDGKGWIGHWSPGIGDPTPIGWLTVFCYGLAAWLCFQVIRCDYDLTPVLSRQEKFLWQLFVGSLVLLGVNKQLDLQSAFTEMGRMIAVYQGWYASRREIQAEFVAAVTLFAVAICFALEFMAHKAPITTRVTLIGFVLLSTFIIVRAASFHHFDVFILHTIAGLRMNWILEIGGLLVIGIGAWLRARA